MPLNLGNFTAWISVDDEELPMYDVTTENTHASCWIPSEVDKKFSVKLEVKPMTTDITGDVYLDGKFAEGRLVPVSDETVERTISSVLTSETTERPFMFSKLELTDDDQYLAASYQDLGEIRLEVCSVIVVETDSGFDSTEAISSPEHVKLHERSKKAIAHHIKFGEESTCEEPMPVDTIEVIATLATFSFRYRPLDILRANGIAPPLPQKRSATLDEVLDLTEVNDGDDSDDDDDKELEKTENQIKALQEKTENQIKALQEQLDAMRQRKRRKTKHVKTEPGVKQEPGIKQESEITDRRIGAGRRNGRIIHLGVIDLT